MKKIVSLIICVLLVALTATACSSTYESTLLKHDYEKDYAQPIVSIAPITEQGKRADGEEFSYTSEPVTILKTQLVTYINNYGSTYVNSYGMSYNDMVDYMLEQLIMTELITIEADIEFEKHEIFWTQEDIDAVQRSVYSSLDSQLTSIYNDILEKAGKDKLVTPDEAESTPSTTYPVREDEEEEATREFDPATCTYGEGKYHDDWYLGGKWFTENEADTSWLPGNHGNLETKSLENEGVKRLITSLKTLSESIIDITDEERATINDEVKKLNETVQNEGVGNAYKNLGKTLLVKKLFGDSAIITQKMTILQDYIENNVSVTDEEVYAQYLKERTEQIASYANQANYDDAVSGSDIILYRPSDRYLYVKHILLPFSEEQTTYLTRYKAQVSTEEYEAERKRLVNNIVVYPHVDGEDDLSRPMTVSQVWSEIKTKMAMASASPFDAERQFDELIYRYNTDPGIFGSELGYSVQYKLNDGDEEKYVAEFAAAARALRDDGYKVGEIYGEPVVTDYGVHIMYYANDFRGGEVLNFNDYTTPGRYTSVKEEIKEDLLSTKRSQEFSNWQNNTIFYYRNTYKVDGKSAIEFHEKAYKDLYQEDTAAQTSGQTAQ